MGTKGYKARPITAKAKDSSRGCSPAPLKQTKEKGWMNQAGHLALDIAGLIPGYGEIADGANAARCKCCWMQTLNQMNLLSRPVTPKN